MEKSKIDFVIDLLKDKKISAQAKEQVFQLASIELKEIERSDYSAWQEVQKLRDELKKGSPNGTELTNNHHHPRYVAELMSLFNRRDGLKYLTHDYDGEGDFDIENFLTHAKEVFLNATNKLYKYGIPSSLYKVVEQFAFNVKPNWTDINHDKLSEGWSTGEWVTWSIKNHRQHPINFSTYRRVINSFRQLTRIKAPEFDLMVKSLVNNVFGDYIRKMNVQYKGLEKGDFYTHVTFFKQGLEFLLKEMALNKPDISFELKRDSEDSYITRTLVICQKDSYPTQSLNDLIANWNSDKGGMGSARIKFHGFCDWSVETLIDDLPYRINILSEFNSPEFEHIPAESVTGFKHILKFYYK